MPVTCQLPGALPGLLFSHATGLTTGGPHAPAAAARDGDAANAASTRAARTRRRTPPDHLGPACACELGESPVSRRMRGAAQPTSAAPLTNWDAAAISLFPGAVAS